MVANINDSTQLDVILSTDGGLSWRSKLNGVGCNANGIPTNPIPGKFYHSQLKPKF